MDVIQQGVLCSSLSKSEFWNFVGCILYDELTPIPLQLLTIFSFPPIRCSFHSPFERFIHTFTDSHIFVGFLRPSVFFSFRPSSSPCGFLQVISPSFHILACLFQLSLSLLTCLSFSPHLSIGLSIFLPRHHKKIDNLIMGLSIPHTWLVYFACLTIQKYRQLLITPYRSTEHTTLSPYLSSNTSVPVYWAHSDDPNQSILAPTLVSNNGQ